MNYIELLKMSAKDAKNCACLGMDPVLDFLPNKKEGASGIAYFFDELFTNMKKEGLIPSAFKPNIGYYTIYDNPFKNLFVGSLALSLSIKLIRSHFGNVPIILDAKRGDIATSSANYAREAFDVWTADATTVSPYMGSDSVEPFFTGAYQEKGVYLLNRTSNKGAADFQNLKVAGEKDSEEESLYLSVSKKIASYAKNISSVGAVVGATGMSELKDVASFFTSNIEGGAPLLIPGVGSQGGGAKDVLSILRECNYDVSIVRINSSSALTHPWKSKDVPKDYMTQCIKNIKSFFEDCSL